MNRFIKYAVVAMTVATMLVPVAALAQITTTPVQGRGVTISEVMSLLQRFVQIAMTAGVIIAVLFFIWGGVKFMTGDSDLSKNEGKNIIKKAAIGALIILGVGVIMSTLAGIVSRQTFQ